MHDAILQDAPNRSGELAIDQAGNVGGCQTRKDRDNHDPDDQVGDCAGTTGAQFHHDIRCFALANNEKIGKQADHSYPCCRACNSHVKRALAQLQNGDDRIAITLVFHLELYHLGDKRVHIGKVLFNLRVINPYAQEIVTIWRLLQPIGVRRQNGVSKIRSYLENARNLTIFLLGETNFGSIGVCGITLRVIMVCKVPTIAHLKVEQTRQTLADVAGARLCLVTTALQPGLLHMERDHALNI